MKLDEELGLCLRYKVPEWRLSRKSAADDIFEWKKNRDIKAEKICLLYVAVTRAQERLILVGTETDRALWHMKSGEARTLAASDYQDLILPALLDEKKKSTSFAQASKPWKITTCDSIQQKNVDNGKVIHNLRPWVETLLSAPPVDDLWKTDPAEKAAEELESGKKAIQILGGKLKQKHEFLLPGTDYGRTLITIQKVKSTPSKYPRKAGTPSKQPLGQENS